MRQRNLMGPEYWTADTRWAFVTAHRWSQLVEPLQTWIQASGWDDSPCPDVSRTLTATLQFDRPPWLVDLASFLNSLQAKLEKRGHACWPYLPSKPAPGAYYAEFISWRLERACVQMARDAEACFNLGRKLAIRSPRDILELTEDIVILCKQLGVEPSWWKNADELAAAMTCVVDPQLRHQFHRLLADNLLTLADRIQTACEALPMKDFREYEVPWDDEDADYLPMKDALEFAFDVFSMNSLSKALNAGRSIHHMRKGQRTRVRIADFINAIRAGRQPSEELEPAAPDKKTIETMKQKIKQDRIHQMRDEE